MPYDYCARDAPSRRPADGASRAPARLSWFPMSVKRIMGTETEYAVSRPGTAYGQPVRLSFEVVGAAAKADERHIRWDYRQEDPVNDARGTRLDRASARPDMLTDAPQLEVTNVIAPNGGRIYVDHAHPEYSSPETLDPFAALAWDKAGDRLMRRAAARASAKAEAEGGAPVVLHRNNVDGKGASWGSHENYAMDRAVPFERVAALMTAHFVSRQVWAGSGHVGIGERSERAGFQLSQRADHFHMKVGLQTTFDRPIINTRDESHDRAGRRRLHVIVGDANLMDTPRALKLGATSMLLWALEHAHEAGYDLDALLDALRLEDPVEAMHEVSHDLSLSKALACEGGGALTAWQMQVLLRGMVYEVAAALLGVDAKGEPLWEDRETRNVMAMWTQALTDVAVVRHACEDERLALAGEASRLEWLLKWQLLERLRRRFACGWDDARLAAFDLQWCLLDTERSPYAKLERAGRVERVVSEAQVARAEREAPEETRAWLRAAVVRRFPAQVVAASWSHLTVRDPYASDGAGDVPEPETYGNASAASASSDPFGRVGGRGLRDVADLDMSDPLAFGRERCAAVLDDAPDAASALRAIAALA